MICLKMKGWTAGKRWKKYGIEGQKRKAKIKEIIKRTENFKEFKKEEEWRKTNPSVNHNEKFLTKKKQW